MSHRIALLLGVLCALGLLLPRGAAAQEAVEYYATDALGSVRVVFASNGTVKGRMDFGPYGEQLTTAEGIGQKVFAQITFDGESAMDYAEARMFQLRTGRFNAPDPVYAGHQDPQRWNRYTYARNNPITLVDPQGLQETAGPNPSLCTPAIREQNPNDYHCQPTNTQAGNGGGGFLMDLSWLFTQWFDRLTFTTAVIDASDLYPQGGTYTPSKTAKAIDTVLVVAAVGMAARSVIAKATGAKTAGAEAATATQPNRIYSRRELRRRAENVRTDNTPEPFHNFPESFNSSIFEQGSRTVTTDFFSASRPGLTNDSVLYQLRGQINGYPGTFEIGVRPSTTGNTEVIMHRFFQPDK